MQQLALAKKAISDNEAKINAMAVETAQKEAEAKTAEDYYNEKKEEYDEAVLKLDNYKNVNDYQEFWEDKCDWNWTETNCPAYCRNDKRGKFQDYAGRGNDGINFNYSWHNCHDGKWKCRCHMPNPNTFAIIGRELVRAQDDMNKAEVDMDKKRKTATEYASRQKPSPQINIACCQNSITCGDASDCNKITQNCEAKISSMSIEEKAAAEKAQAAQAAQAPVGQKSSNTVSNRTSSSSKNTIISSIILCCCLLLIIAIIFIFMKSK